MANAVIYARYSSHNQRDESIEDQVRVCRDAAERAGDRVVLDRARGEMRVEFSVGGPGDPDDPGSPRGCSREYLWPHSPENGRTPSSETETGGSRTYQLAGAEGFEPP